MTHYIIDIIVFFIITLFIYRGLKKGAIVELTLIIALLAGIIASVELTNGVMAYFKPTLGSSFWLPYLCYLIVFLGVFLLIQLLGKALEKILKITQLNFLNRLMGAILSVLKISFFISLIFWLTDQAELINKPIKEQALSYQYLSPIAPLAIEKTTHVFPLLKNAVSDLELFFEGIGEKLPD